MKTLVIPTVLIGLSLTSCGTSPQDLGKNHLELLKAGKSSDANQQYCVPKDSLSLYSVKEFEILSSQSKTQNGKSYIEVVAKVDTDQSVLKNAEVNGVPVRRKQPIQQVTLEIWKSDDIYNMEVSNIAKLNEISQKNKMGLKSLRVPNKSEFSSASLCVVLPSEQFEDDELK
jgi:hypothetical protein